MREVAATLLASVLVLALVGGVGVTAVQRLLHHTLLTDDGTVSLDGDEGADPEMLARDAEMTLDAYALARMVQSEAGGLRSSALLGVAYAAVTYASKEGKAISAVLLHSTGAGDGFFGRQSQGRYAATTKDPGLSAIDAANAALAGTGNNPVPGADQWDSPHAYHDDARAAEVAAAREAAGKEAVALSDVSASVIRFWRPTT